MTPVAKQLISILCILSAAFCQAQQADNTITIASGEWSPYISADLPNYGITSHIVSEAFALAGIRVEYHFLPWKRGMELARAGELHATLGWAITEERKKDFWFSQEPIAIDRTVFFYHKDSPINWESIWSQSKKHRVGATIGYDYGEKFNNSEAVGHFLVQRYAEDKIGLHHLLKKQIDFFPIDVFVAKHILRQHFPLKQKQFSYVETPLYEGPLYLLFSKQHPESQQLKMRFDEGIKKLRESGRLAELQQQ